MRNKTEIGSLWFMSQQKNINLDALIGESHRLGKNKDYENQLLTLKAICKLLPDDPGWSVELALAHIRTGDPAAATGIMAHAILAGGDKTATFKRLFIIALSSTQLTEFNLDYKQALHKCLEDQYDCEMQALMAPWLRLLMLSDKTAQLKAALFITEARDFQTLLTSNSTLTDVILNDDFFLDGITSLIMADPLFEIFLTRLRRFLCLNIQSLESTGRIRSFRRILFALARQCYINEFVFLPERDELNIVNQLKNTVDELTEYGVAVLACYEPLHDALSDDMLKALIDRESDTDFLELIRVQCLNRFEEKQNEENIEAFGEISNTVSTDVRSQYEANPYPRWLSASRESTPLDDTVVDITQPCRMLVAGCGTGQHAISAAARHPNAAVVAIDLSRRSLGYAVRKASEAGLLNRIRFVQADILSMNGWPEQFDIIECCGVLHHMEDPVAGWKTLVDRLKPGGYLKIGLYSCTARTAVVQAREYIQSNALDASTESIRQMRYVIFSQPVGSNVRDFFVHSVDFYTTSRVRDAIFNVQEHQFDLREISEIIDQLNLEFVRFTLNRSSTSRLYKEKFSEDPKQTNLKNWAELEAERPGIFSGMYQFWVRKSF